MSSQTGRLNIRQAEPADAARCGDIAVAAWRPVYASFREMLGDELYALNCPEWEASKRGQVEHHITEYPQLAIVTELGGEIIAFLTYRLFPDAQKGEIFNNAVDPAHQGKGAGTRQCEHVLGLFREAGLKFATVYTGLDESHAPARAMYERVGFDTSTPHIRYYMTL